MALIKDITKEVEIPHEAGESMTFRKLSWRQIDEASEARQSQVLRNMRDMGGDLIKAISESNSGDSEAVPSAKYCKDTVLVNGIVGWSYKEKVTPDNIRSLDKETADWAFLQIVELTEGEEGDRKKG